MKGDDRLTSSQRERLKAIFHDAIELPPPERLAFVSAASADDAALEAELSSLLEAYPGSADFFQRLAMDLVSPHLLALAHESDEFSVGDIVSHYEIIGKIGRGGMGVVYKARDASLGRTVALKVLPQRHAANPVARSRLLAEAQAASALDHPNIGVVYEIGDIAGDRPFIAMAWYEGETLREKLGGGQLSSSEILSVGSQLGSALAAAHSAGIVHCDVKPANVLVTRSGAIKLVDFGIAKLASAEAASESDTAGTPAYMSPEHMRGDPVDARTDIWSLGVLLYECVTGVRPFSTDTVEHAHDQVRGEAIEIFRPGVPRSLSVIIEKCLQKEPANRYQSANDFLDALNLSRIENTTPQETEPPVDRLGDRRQHRSKLYAIAAVLVVAVLGSAVYYAPSFGRAAATADPAPITVAVTDFANRNRVAADEHLVSGFTDEVIGTLRSVEGLKVIERSSSSALARQGLSPLAIGRRLGAAAIVQGDVSRVGGKLSVTVGLIDVADSTVTWSKTYERPVAQTFALQQEVTRSLVQALARPGSALGVASPAQRPTRDSEAYEMYLKGRLSWSERTRTGLEQALAYYVRALDKDPEFALAHAGLAATYHNMSNFGYMEPHVALARADVASARAVALDTMSVDAAAVRGYVLASLGRYRESETEFKRATRLNPRYAWTHHYYALLLIMLGRDREAMEQIRGALTLDPLSQPANATLGILLTMRGSYAEARAQYEHSMSLSPTFALTRYAFGGLAAREGRYDEAIELLEPAVVTAPDFPGIRATLAYAYSRAGRPGDARRVTAQLQAAVRDERSRVNLALGHGVLGNHDTAFDMLQTAVWDAPTLIDLRANPLLEQLRANPRYRLLLAKYGLTP